MNHKMYYLLKYDYMLKLQLNSIMKLTSDQCILNSIATIYFLTVRSTYWYILVAIRVSIILWWILISNTSFKINLTIHFILRVIKLKYNPQ